VLQACRAILEESNTAVCPCRTLVFFAADEALRSTMYLKGTVDALHFFSILIVAYNS
jgi:hypothetical protein